MTAAQLANRVAMSALIDFNMEDASAPQQLPQPPAEVLLNMKELFPEDMDLLAGDDDLDLMQMEAESDFFSQMNANRGHRAERRSYQNW